MEFVIHGTPPKKDRPRENFRKTAKDKEREKVVAFSFLACGNKMMFEDCPLKISVRCYYPVPKSWTKKKKALMIGKYKTSTPDLDNIFKSIKDGLNGIAYKDDSRIVAYGESYKKWIDEDKDPYTVVELEEIF